MTKLTIVAIALTLIVWHSPARSRAADQKVPAAIAPYLDGSTIGVVRADLTRLDPQAAEAWVNDLLKAANAPPADAAEITGGLKAMRPAAEQWLAGFRKAGGREVYVVIVLADMPSPPVVLVPLAAGADAAAAVRLFGPEPQKDALHAYGFERPVAERVGDVVAYATPKQLKRLREMKPADRPDLAGALGAAGDAPLAAAVAPSADVRRAIGELLPSLPKEVGGGPSSALTRGLQWASLAVRPPPQPSVRLVIQSQDAAAAEALSEVIGKGLGRLADEVKAHQRHGEQLLGQRPGAGGDPAAAILNVLTAVTPKTVGDRLEVSLDAEAINRLAGALVVPMGQQRATARRQVSANNMKQVLLACYLYADPRKGEWPPDLATLAKQQELSPQVLANPQKPGTGYTYLKPPAKPTKPVSDVVVLYESEPSDVGGAGGKALNVGFMDGHVEFMGEAGLKERLKAQQERR